MEEEQTDPMEEEQTDPTEEEQPDPTEVESTDPSEEEPTEPSRKNPPDSLIKRKGEKKSNSKIILIGILVPVSICLIIICFLAIYYIKKKYKQRA